MLHWLGPINSGAAVGATGTGDATSYGTSPRVHGKIHAVYVKYNESPPAGTTDVTIATLGTSPSVPAITILSLANAATDALKYPRVQVHGTDGVALTTDGTRILTDKIAVDDAIKVTIAQANDGDNADVWICLED